jgi:acyl-CoA reductase-like NAD-dependent aldehyde dehydrogenase
MQSANLIAGQWVSGASTNTNINPSDTDDIIGEFANATSAQVEMAVAAAREAFPAWSHTSPQVRADLLDKIGTEILARREELGNLLAREEGKTLAEAIGEVSRAGHIFRFFGGEALRMTGDLQPSIRAGVEVSVMREPVGVVGIITPWNFPLAIPAWKIAPALAFGNCVAFKPAELVPGCAYALAQIIERAGVPAGVFNLTMGSGAEVGAALVSSPGLHALSFTGSVPTGGKIQLQAAQHGLKLQLEMGGKNALVVLNDAQLQTAAQVALDGAFYSTGQRCTASSRLIVEAGIYDQFVAALGALLKKQVVDDARQPGTSIGPVVDRVQLDKNLRYLRIGVEEGARLLQGGPVRRAKPGFYMEPVLFADTHNAMRINQEEVFGPVACLIRVANYEEALAVANDSPFGLCAGICTSSLKYAQHFRREVAAGMVMVNLPTAGVDYHVPFGGIRASSYGPREQGRYAAEFYTRTRTSYLRSDV